MGKCDPLGPYVTAKTSPGPAAFLKSLFKDSDVILKTPFFLWEKLKHGDNTISTKKGTGHEPVHERNN